MTCAAPAIFLLLALTPLLVESFTFPGDWHKIRQMMEARQEQESQDYGGGLLTRGSFVFDDEVLEDVIDWNTFQFSTTSTTTPKPKPRPLEAIMDDLMNNINITEVLIRFGGSDQSGLSVRNAFSVQQTPEPPAAFSASASIWKFTLTLVRRGLVEQSSGNALFSPVSILTTLNMLLLGTVGNTRTEILQALGYPRYTADVHSQFKNIIKSMNRDIGVTVATSNSLFHQEHHVIVVEGDSFYFLRSASQLRRVLGENW